MPELVLVLVLVLAPVLGLLREPILALTQELGQVQAPAPARVRQQLRQQVQRGAPVRLSTALRLPG